MKFILLVLIFLKTTTAIAGNVDIEKANFLALLNYLLDRNDLSFERPVQLEEAYKEVLTSKPPQYIRDFFERFWTRYNELSPVERIARSIMRRGQAGSFYAVVMNEIGGILEQRRRDDEDENTFVTSADDGLSLFIDANMDAFIAEQPDKIKVMSLLDAMVEYLALG